MRYKGATPSGNFLDDYETSRAYAVEFLRACDGHRESSSRIQAGTFFAPEKLSPLKHRTGKCAMRRVARFENIGIRSTISD